MRLAGDYLLALSLGLGLCLATLTTSAAEQESPRSHSRHSAHHLSKHSVRHHRKMAVRTQRHHPTSGNPKVEHSAYREAHPNIDAPTVTHATDGTAPQQ
jgi:hypothetical protein